MRDYRARWPALWLMLLCLVIACSESFLPASAVTDLRAVAARVDVEGKPGRANPDPGDDVRVSILVIDQGMPASDFPSLTPPPLQWAFVACVPQPTLIGSPICRTPIEPCEGCVETPPADPFAVPIMRFQVPSQEELEQAEADTVLVQGAVCANGTPSEDAVLRFLMGETEGLAPCEGPIMQGLPVQGRFVTVQIPIEQDPSDPNLHPELSDVTWNGAPWPPPYDQGVLRSAPRTGCREDLEGLTDEERMAHPVAGTPPSTINLRVTQDSLQTFTAGDMEAIEEIQVSWLADGGGFESTFSFITNPARSVLTQWQPFEDAPQDGGLVRFNFVIRDGRGGTDWVERGLCVLPAPPAESPP